MRGAGRVAFAAILLLVVGTINIIYGIGALDDASIFVNDTRFVLDNLNTPNPKGSTQLFQGFGPDKSLLERMKGAQKQQENSKCGARASSLCVQMAQRGTTRMEVWEGSAPQSRALPTVT